MDGEFGEKLKSILSDPEAMAKITAIASSLGANSKSEEPTQGEEPSTIPDPAKAIGAMLNPTAGNDPKIQLLTAVKPLLREEKRDRVDSLVRALTIAAMMKGFRK